MNELFEVLRDYEAGQISRADALAVIASQGANYLHYTLSNYGLPASALAANSDALAALYLALHELEQNEDRDDSDPTADGLINGTLYTSDSNDVVHRIAYRDGDRVEVWDLTTLDDGTPWMEPHSNYDASNLGDLDLGEIYEKLRDEDDLTGEIPYTTSGPDCYHYKFNLKVVMWIPYRDNNIPLFNKVLPDAMQDPNMDQSMRVAQRIMLATGNPTPPETLTDAQYDALIDSKEFRGAAKDDITLCCGTCPDFEADPKFEVGYTPAAVSVGSEFLSLRPPPRISLWRITTTCCSIRLIVKAWRKHFSIH